MYISYMGIYEQHIEIVIGWHMVYMCIHYRFTQMTRIKGLQDSFTLVCDVEAGAQTSVLIPQQKSFIKICFFSCLSPKQSVWSSFWHWYELLDIFLWLIH